MPTQIVDVTLGEDVCSIHRAVAFTILREQCAILLCHSACGVYKICTPPTGTLQSEVMILSACDKETDASNITTCPDLSLSLSPLMQFSAAEQSVDFC